MKPFLPFSLIILAVTLAACGTASTPVPAIAAPPQTASPGEASPARWGEQTPILDEQGAVTVEITPLNLNDPGETLDFRVVLNTHSVDLSMDLATLATLTTDTGKTVQPAKWDAPAGGHHASGTLSFPAMVEGGLVLDGVSKLTLTLVDVDAPERVFVWAR